MKGMKKPWLVTILLLAVIIVAGSYYVGSSLIREDPLSEKDIRTQLEEKYGGTVDQISRDGRIYRTEMMRQGAVYAAEIDAFTGQVLSLNQLSKPEKTSPKILSEKEVRDIIAGKYTGEIERISLNESEEVPMYEVEVAKEQALVTVRIDALVGEIISEKVQEEPAENVLITRERAIEIALGQLQGEVEYVTFKQTDDGGYYLVEIEQDDEDGHDDLEAIFQIHAISGEIMSVTWDD